MVDQVLQGDRDGCEVMSVYPSLRLTSVPSLMKIFVVFDREDFEVDRTWALLATILGSFEGPWGPKSQCQRVVFDVVG